jgi:hypothetical protein
MRTLTIAAFLAALCGAATAFAGGGPTSSVACGYSYGSWSAPNGSLVTNRSSGVVKGVIDAIGEYRTHSMLSHGTLGWVTHNTMQTPGTNDVCKACDEPIRANELQNGYPGASQTNMGGIYEFLYSEGGVEALFYQAGGADGEKVANCTWSNFPYTYVASQQSGSGLYRLKHPQTQAFIPYWVYAYKDGNWAGDDNGFFSTDWHANEQKGMVCSTFLAYLSAHYTGNYTNSRYYNGNQACNAMWGLAGNIQSECNSTQGFWAGLGAGVACFFCDFDTNVCDDAGRQTARCFATNNCDNGHDDLSNSYCSGGATSLSPDQLGGWLGDKSSKWGNSGNNYVYWNGAGSTYGCWF